MKSNLPPLCARALMCSLVVMTKLPAADLGTVAPTMMVQRITTNTAPITDKGRSADANLKILVFIETGCSACVKSIPVLNELQSKYGPKGVALIAVSRESSNVVQTFVNAMRSNIAFTV